MMAESPGPSASAADPRIGRVLQDRYRITARVAAGGMGIVYRGERIGLGRVVAIKFLHSSMAREPQSHRRFEIEAQAMSRLSHPNCVGVLDFGVDELPYVVIDFVEGVPLDQVLGRGRLPARRAVKIVRQILAALAHAHAQGIIHRDIKPENVILEGTPGLADHVRILDFGLAKLVGSDFGLTVGLAVGTPHYMAPEQMSEGPIDGRVDLYAAGIVLFELLTGKKPFDAEELGDIFLRHLGAPPPKLREFLPEANFSVALEAVVLKAMAKRPDDRYASAEAMAAALDDVPEAFATPGPEAVFPAGEMSPKPAYGAAHAMDATVPWSSSRLALPIDVPPTSAAGPREVVWYRWFLERPFRLAVASGLGSALLAGAMVTIGFSGRPRGPEAAPTKPNRAEVVIAPPAETRPAAPAAGPPVVAGRRAPVAKPAGKEPGRKLAVEGSRAAGFAAAAEAVAAGRKAFAEGRYAAGLDAFRAAIKRDPRRRDDAAILDPVIASLESDKRGQRAAFLRELDAAAVPALRTAAKSHPNSRVRARAAELLPAPPPAPPKKRPFLRWL